MVVSDSVMSSSQRLRQQQDEDKVKFATPLYGLQPHRAALLQTQLGLVIAPLWARDLLVGLLGPLALAPSFWFMLDSMSVTRERPRGGSSTPARNTSGLAQWRGRAHAAPTEEHDSSSGQARRRGGRLVSCDGYGEHPWHLRSL
jgi:hypothetical protein